MEKFIGTWNLVDSENFDAFLEKQNLPEDKRKMLANAKPQIIFEKNGNKWKIGFNIDSKISAGSEFDLDKEFEHTTPNGRLIRSIFHFKDGKLIDEQTPITPPGKKIRIESSIEGDKLITVGECDGVKCRRVHQKA